MATGGKLSGRNVGPRNMGLKSAQDWERKLNELEEMAKRQDALQRYNPDTGDYEDIDVDNPASQFFKAHYVEDESDGEDDELDLAFDLSDATNAKKSKDEKKTKRSPSRAGSPTALTEYHAMRKRAQDAGELQFEWKGKVYVRDSRESKKWRKAVLPTDVPIVDRYVPLATAVPQRAGSGGIKGKVAEVKATVLKDLPVAYAQPAYGTFDPNLPMPKLAPI